MSHAIYQTRAVILATKNMRESNKLLVAYTEKFGLMYISTQSIRELKSKMRFHAHSLSLVDIDIVEGRGIWKLTGIHEQLSSMKIVGTIAYELLSDVASVIMRLCNGEDPQEDLWRDISILYTKIFTSTIEEDEKNIIEIIMAVRILYHLGYWEGDVILCQKDIFIEEQYQYVLDNKKKLVAGINEAFIETQL